MTRIVAFYLTLLAIMVTAMIWVTQRTLALERDEQVTALGAENERLALWRMESLLLPLILQESTRDYSTVSGDPQLFPGPVQDLSQDVRCYFQCDSQGQIEVLIPVTTAADGQVVRDDVAACPELERWLHADTSDPRFFETLREALPDPDSAVWPVQMAAVPGQQGSLEPNLNQKKQQLQFVPQQAIPQQTQGEFAKTQVGQQLRSQQEFTNRMNNMLVSNSAYINPFARNLYGADEQRPMTALWLNDRLYLARTLNSAKTERGQGCMLNWERLKPRLIESISDLLPEADLVPIAMGEVGDHLALATLPMRLEPGSPLLQELPVWSPLKVSLGVAWSCFLLSAAALGILLFGTARLSERRAAFVSAVTHELRTPLTTFRLYADLLANRNQLSDDKYSGYIETLQNEAERLEYLVENVLSWSRLEQSADTALIDDLDWNDLLNRLLPALHDRARQAGMQLELTTTDDAHLRIRGNWTAVERILFNLVDNACKYAKSAGDKRIHLEIHASAREVVIGVRDHGPGIPAEAQSKLFRPFTKSAADAARSAPGVGLGLSLSRRLARSMSGDLVFTHCEPGVSFQLKLPRAS